MLEIPQRFYRISVKALILNEEKDKFLICKKENGFWELPGGGLEWGATPKHDLPREIREEMNLDVTWMADNPSYFITCQNLKRDIWVANVIYETKLEHLNFTPSAECTEVRFVSSNDIVDLNVFFSVRHLSEMFKPENHRL